MIWRPQHIIHVHVFIFRQMDKFQFQFSPSCTHTFSLSLRKRWQEQRQNRPKSNLFILTSIDKPFGNIRAEEQAFKICKDGYCHTCHWNCLTFQMNLASTTTQKENVQTEHKTKRMVRVEPIAKPKASMENVLQC